MAASSKEGSQSVIGPLEWIVIAVVVVLVLLTMLAVVAGVVWLARTMSSRQ